MRQFWDGQGLAAAADLAGWLQQRVAVQGLPEIARYGRLSKESQVMVLETIGLAERVPTILREGA
eukprot:11225589-Lingulodinium_polyedra.AAC.1